MESILTELFYLWSERGAFPRHAALQRRLDRLHRLTEGCGDGGRVWDACMEYADLLEQQAFEMGFTWSAALRGEIARFCPPPETLYEKSPASGA